MVERGRKPTRPASGDRTYVCWLIVGDVCICALSLVLAYSLRVFLFYVQLLPPLRHPLDVYLAPLPVVVVVWLIALESSELYRPRRSVSRFTEFVAIVKACTLTVVVVMALAYLSKHDYSRTLTVLFWVLLVNLSWAYRSAMSAMWRRELQAGRWRRRALIVGCGELGGMVLARMRQHPDFGYEPVGFISWNGVGGRQARHGL
ncbi:MAG: hypothetical protein ACE5O2_01075, partial [Armatimonadota bacterium]